MYTVPLHGRGADLPFFFLSATVQYWYRQAQAYGKCTRVIYLTQHSLYVEHHTEKQLVPYFKTLVIIQLIKNHTKSRNFKPPSGILRYYKIQRFKRKALYKIINLKFRVFLNIFLWTQIIYQYAIKPYILNQTCCYTLSQLSKLYLKGVFY